jgi:alanine dehydrogenase
MLIGVTKEIKVDEYRVGLTPASVRELVSHGHEVLVERQAGEVIGLHDEDYERVGAMLVAKPEEIFQRAEMIVKVKEPQPQEVEQLRAGQVLFTYLHLAASPELTRTLAASGCTGIAYETVTDQFGGLPLLAPMSEVAGRMSVQAGAHCLEIEQGGRGMLLGGVPGTPPAKVTIVGGGNVGANAARVALGMEADVTILDISLHTLARLDTHFGGGLNTVFSTVDSIQEYVLQADLVVGAVLVPGAAAPKLITEAMVRDMKRGAVLVDVAIDQGGCAETSRPTTHSQPTYKRHDVVHYCVANMPGAVARTSAVALNNATLPFVLQLANKGANTAMAENVHLLRGLNVYNGHVTYEPVAQAAASEYVPADTALRNGKP